MGVGRREFMKLMSAALSGAVIAPNAVIATNEDYYVNKKLGILFKKPKDWGYVALNRYEELKDSQKLSEVPDEDLDELWELLEGPSCIITKYYEQRPENYGIFSPTIQFQVNHKSQFDDIEYETFEEFIELSQIGTSMFLKDFDVHKKNKPYFVEGVQFLEYEASYTFEHVELDSPLKVRLNVIFIEHNNYFYSINLHDCPEQKQTADEEFRAFKKSLRMM